MLLLGLSAPSGVSAQQVAADGSLPGLNALGACVQQNRQLAAVFLIDESASLKKTDPEKQRVVAAKTALQTLAGLGAQDLGGGTKPRVDVTIAAFGENFTTVDPWRQLSYSNLAQAKTAVDQFTNRDGAFDTDYYAALAGARKELTDHVATMDGATKPCRAVLWFTDGEYSINGRRPAGSPTTKDYAPEIQLGTPTAADELLAKGKDLLCQPGGLADQLRQDGGVTIAVALAAGIERKDQDLLQAMATGRGGAQTCGDKGSDNTGAYIAANDLGTLVASFDAVANVIGYGTQAPPRGGIPICVTNPCAEGKYKFPVDPGMTRFHVLLQTGVAGATVQVASPEGGATKTLQVTEEGEETLGTVKLRYAWLAPDVMTVDGFLPPDAAAKWNGEWGLTVVAPTAPPPTTTAGARLFYYGDVHARLDTTTKLSAKNDTSLKIGLGYGTDGPVLGGDLLTKAVSNMTVKAAKASGGTPVDARVGSLKDGKVAVVIPADKAWEAGPIELSVTTSFTTRSGVVLRPLSDTFTLGEPAVAAPKSPAAKKSGGISAVLLAGGAAAIAAALALLFFLVRFLRGRKRAAPGNPIPGLDTVLVGRYRLRVKYGATTSIEFLDERGNGIPFRISKELVRDRIMSTDGDRTAQVGAIHLEGRGDRVAASCTGMRLVSNLNMHGGLEDGGQIAYLPSDLGQGWVFVGGGSSPNAVTQFGQNAAISSDVPPGMSNRTVNIADTGAGGSAKGIDGELYLFAGPSADFGQMAQSANILLPALAQAIAASRL